MAGLDLGTSFVKAVCVELDPASDQPVEVVGLLRAPTPGTAPELVATALGLLAAIPAVIFYNKLSSDANRISGGHEAFADEFATILSPQIEAG